MAAETLVAQDQRVEIYDRMPTPGRKFLMAGRGGLNLTHSEDRRDFLSRYHDAADWLEPMIEAFSPQDLRAWADELGAETFIGSSGRVFPKAMKASPILRAWRRRLEDQGVVFRLRHDWQGWDGAELVFETPHGQTRVETDGLILALGGASWPRLGADGGWVARLGADQVTPFEPSNAGVEIGWSEVHKTRFAGAPLKNIAVRCGEVSRQGEMVIAEYGLEGGAIYALGASLRAGLARGDCEISVDLRPQQSVEAVAAKLSRARKGASLSTRLTKTLGLSAQAASLVREAGMQPRDDLELARRIKTIPLHVERMRGLERAISSAGGVRREALGETLMLRDRPGVFAAGEMLDWDAPTGGYLLQATFATGRAAANGLLDWLNAEAR